MGECMEPEKPCTNIYRRSNGSTSSLMVCPIKRKTRLSSEDA